MSIQTPYLQAVSAAAHRGSARRGSVRVSSHMPGRVGNWPDPMRQLCSVGNGPDPMRRPGATASR